MEKSDKIFLWLIFLSVLAVIGVTGYKFLIYKDYDFYVEAPCDSSTRVCFIRDCSELDSCPPNNLDNYRIFYLKAKDFSKCENNSCLSVCENKIIECREQVCGENKKDICSFPNSISQVGSQ